MTRLYQANVKTVLTNTLAQKISNKKNRELVYYRHGGDL